MAENTADVNAKTEVKATELAVVLGLGVRRIQQMVQDGTLPTVKRGVFNLPDAVQSYISFITKSKGISEQDEAKLKAEVSIKKAKAVKAMLEANELQGKMHRSEDVAAMTEDLIYSIRGALVSLPGRLAVDVSATDTPAEAAEVIRKEVYKVMKELSEYKYNPKKYEERVRGRMDWDSIESDPDDE